MQMVWSTRVFGIWLVMAIVQLALLARGVGDAGWPAGREQPCVKVAIGKGEYVCVHECLCACVGLREDYS